MGRLGTLICLLFISFSLGAQSYINTYNNGVQLFKEKQYEDAKADFVKAKEEATAANDESMVAKVNGNLAKVAYKLGAAAYKARDFETALAYHQEGYGVDATYPMNLYGEGRTLGKMGKAQEGIAKLEEAIASGNEKVAKASLKSMKNIGYKFSQNLLKGEPSPEVAGDVLAVLSKVESNGAIDENGFYYMAKAYAVQEDHANTIASVDKALALSKGSAEDNAKFHYIKGKALMDSGQNDAAIEAFKNAKHGQYEKNAQILIDRLSQ